MDNIKTLFLAVLALVSFASCIKDEAPNQEADILSCKVGDGLLIREPIITNDEVRLYVNGWTDLTNLAPIFTLTEGATIEPASGTARNFTTPQNYTVTSQDGRWKKTYKVSFLSDDLATEYHFENMKWYEYADDESQPAKKYFHIFFDKTSDNSEMEWGSGNAGFMITNNNAQAEDYPTSQANDGYIGKCAKLTTVSAGELGKMFGAPIAAGNLFTGTFQINPTDMLKSTRFGLPFSKKPLELTGYYKYKAGTTFTNKEGNEVKGQKDDFSIYAVFYEVTPEVTTLDGTNSQTSPNIVLAAQLDERHETDRWTRFSIPFKPVANRTIDAEKLKAGKYNLAIIMSSSKDGGLFNGAVGSTLYVDELQLFYEK